MAAGDYFFGRAGTKKPRVLIGKDTRLSGYMLEPALVSGFTSVGLDAITTGPMPTPAIAHLTRALRCDLGVMISASHNPYEDNGLKLFGSDGFKLNDDVENEIQSKMEKKNTFSKIRKLGQS
jgi:phosphoglucosamine mutase